MQYALLIHLDDAPFVSASDEQREQMTAPYAAYNEALIKAGAMVSGERLRPATAATLVKVRGDKTEVLDGPYADTKEQLAGFYIVEAADVDEATSGRRAARAPATARSRCGRSGRCGPRSRPAMQANRAKADGADAARRAAEAAARASYGKLVAYLAARSRDVAGAEDALSEAFAAALAQWPRDGVPQNPRRGCCRWRAGAASTRSAAGGPASTRGRISH